MSKIHQPEGKLFKQSSELEILISAAIVFAVFKIQDAVPYLLVTMINNNIPNNSPYLVIVSINALFLGTLLPISIVAHFILRFYWLALIGLRNAYDKEGVKSLNYADRFKSFINKKFHLDDHIQSIDRITSSIFAFSFLSIFIFCFTLSSIIIIYSFLKTLGDEAEGILHYVYSTLGILIILFSVLTLIDFLTLGALKKIKNRWFVAIYYPISRIMSVVTLSFVYRGLYYTFISRTPRKLTFIGIPLYLFIAIFLLNVGYHESRLFDFDYSGVRMEEAVIMTDYYEDELDPLRTIQLPFIQSDIIEENYVKINFPMTEELEDALISGCDGVEPIQSRGIHWRRWITTDWNKRDLPGDFDYKKNAMSALQCFAGAITIRIDNTIFTAEEYKFDILNEPRKKIISTIIPINTLAEGYHVLELTSKSPLEEKSVRISFYRTGQ